jgi:hypothetical protein
MPQKIKLSTTVPEDTKGWAESRKVRPRFAAKLEMLIDWDALAAELAKRAAGNKSRKATLLGGIVKATITSAVPPYNRER